LAEDIDRNVCNVEQQQRENDILTIHRAVHRVLALQLQ
jgi:hypothetical protein